MVDVDYWFGRNAKRQLGGLSAAIKEEAEPEINRLLSVCLSACVRKVSFADPRFSVPVRVQRGSPQWKRASDCDVVELFLQTVNVNVKRLAVLQSVIGNETPDTEIGNRR